MESPALGITEEDQIEDHENSINHKIPREPFDQHIDETVYLVIEQRLQALEQTPAYSNTHLRKWSKNVRLYTLLRMLNYREGDDIFKKFEREEIGDSWLPLTDSILKQLSSVPEFKPAAQLAFKNAQRHVMSDSKEMDEKHLVGPFFRQQSLPRPRTRTHRSLEYARAHFEDLGEIGRGSSAQVLRVRHKLSEREFACKRLLRNQSRPLSAQRGQMKAFEQEVKVLQGIRHDHIVSLVASFTDLETSSLILDPIADSMLLEILKHPLSEQETNTLCASFNCLATALAFLHAHRVRHKDIKPSNILLSNGRVLLCDFGISLEWTNSDHGTTEGGNSSFTRRYAAPEVLRIDASRNSKTDVWSLGCVFLEIFSALNGVLFDDIELSERMEGQEWSSIAMKSWLRKIKEEKGDIRHDLPMRWVLLMITDQAHERPEASQVVDVIHEDAAKHGLTVPYLASCCRKPEYDLPESSIPPVQPSTPALEPCVHNSIAAPQCDVCLPRNRYRPSSSQRSEGILSPARKSSGGSTSIRIPSIRWRNGRSEPINAPDSAVFPSVRTSTVTRGTSLRSDSAFYETPEMLGITFGEPPDINAHERNLGASTIKNDSPDSCGVHDNEENLFKEFFVTFEIAKSSMVTQFAQCCDKAENTIQLFETPCANMTSHQTSPSPRWKVTRRMVLCNAGSPGSRGCYSFWLPLADIRFFLNGATVTLHWSDCNQPQHQRTYDQREYWSWVYDPVRPNNEITIEFCNLDAAKHFLNIVRFPLDDGVVHRISDSEEIRVWKSVNAGKTESIVSVTQCEESFSDSKLFVVGQYIDPYFEPPSTTAHFNVRLNNVSTPNYLSDLTQKPIQGRNRVAQFREVHLKPASLAISTPFEGDPDSPVTPTSVDDMFLAITGWRLQYFASVEQLKSEKHAMSRKRYGAADVLLWRKEALDTVSACITFRLHRNEDVWMSGRISASTCVLSISKDAACSFDMFGKRHGRLLDASSMTAVTDPANEDLSSVDPALGFQQESRRMTLQFQNHKHRRKFAELVEELTLAIKRNPPPAVNRTRVSRTSFHPRTPLA